MSQFPSNVLITEALNLIKNDTPYMALYTTNPTAADTGTEVTGGGYSRQAITFGSITGGSMSNTVAVTFASLPNATVTHFGIRDASTSGDLKTYGALNASGAVIAGDQITFPIGSIVVNLSGS